MHIYNDSTADLLRGEGVDAPGSLTAARFDASVGAPTRPFARDTLILCPMRWAQRLGSDGRGETGHVGEQLIRPTATGSARAVSLGARHACKLNLLR